MTRAVFSLDELFNKQQKKLESELRLSKTLYHPGDNGDNSEKSWISFLEQFLPKRYRIAKATVIDSNGDHSDQLDIVIYDQQYSYLVFQMNEITYIPAESVYAAFEVKPRINLENLTYASKKANSLRSLRRTSTSIVSANGILKPKELHEIIFGILAFESTDYLGSKNFLENISFDDSLKKITCGCSLDNGAFFYF